MTGDRWDELSERLNDGDVGAAAETFVEAEPYLRMVVRRQLTPRLRSRFDSQDVVQSVWSDTLLRRMEGGAPGWEFRDGRGLRSFLARLARSRFLDLCRRHRASLALEQPFADAGGDGLPGAGSGTPSEVSQADDLWAQLLSLCPPAHHEVLRLKLKGAPLHEIARQTGLHESSVRRVLYELADRLHAEKATREVSPTPDAPVRVHPFRPPPGTTRT